MKHSSIKLINDHKYSRTPQPINQCRQNHIVGAADKGISGRGLEPPDVSF